jgi:hypothetical protein
MSSRHKARGGWWKRVAKDGKLGRQILVVKCTYWFGLKNLEDCHMHCLGDSESSSQNSLTRHHYLNQQIIAEAEAERLRHQLHF